MDGLELSSMRLSEIREMAFADYWADTPFRTVIANHAIPHRRRLYQVRGEDALTEMLELYYYARDATEGDLDSSYEFVNHSFFFLKTVCEFAFSYRLMDPPKCEIEDLGSVGASAHAMVYFLHTFEQFCRESASTLSWVLALRLLSALAENLEKHCFYHQRSLDSLWAADDGTTRETPAQETGISCLIDDCMYAGLLHYPDRIEKIMSHVAVIEPAYAIALGEAYVAAAEFCIPSLGKLRPEDIKDGLESFSSLACTAIVESWTVYIENPARETHDESQGPIHGLLRLSSEWVSMQKNDNQSFIGRAPHIATEIMKGLCALIEARHVPLNIILAWLCHSIRFIAQWESAELLVVR